MADYLFVYGTLRRASPHPMARLLERRGRFLGESRVPGKLFDLGRFPGMVPCDAKEGTVAGDVYELTDPEALAELDRYENAESPLPAFFERALTPVTLSDGVTVDAWVYWYRGYVDERQRVASGDYRQKMGT
jgi:gamma-glutamylcyclotransferase (GGCT)/AIG2-like uncharacterized protein YtfP